MKLFKYFLIVVFALPCMGQATELPAGISASLSIHQQSFSIDDQLLVEVEYENTTAAPISLLTWGTALEGEISHNIFSVVQNGTELPYVGRHYKRPQPTAKDFVEIPAFSSVKGVVDLLTAYAINHKGNYQLSYRDHQHQSGHQAAVQNGLNFSLKSNRPIVAYKRPPNFQNCDATQRTQLDRAVGDAERISKVARDALRNTPEALRSSAQRYTRWFGTYNAARWNRVRSNFEKIYSAANSQVLRFVCEADNPNFAAVNPSQPYNIFIGQAFWQAPANGTDSKSGVIVHELSHFSILGGTNVNSPFQFQREVYGTSANLALAINSPDHASWNAESHEYFAENTPFFNMPEVLVSATLTSVRPTTPRRGATIALAANLRNQGNVQSPGITYSIHQSSDQNISLADAQVGSGTTTGIAAGASRSVAGNARVPNQLGQYWYGICISALNVCSNSIGVEVIEGNPGSIVAPIWLLLEEDD